MKYYMADLIRSILTMAPDGNSVSSGQRITVKMYPLSDEGADALANDRTPVPYELRGDWRVLGISEEEESE